MKKKTIAKVVIILVACIAVFVLIELLVRNIANRHFENEDRKEYVDKLPKITEIQKKREETFVTYTNEIVKLIEERNYEKIYSYFSTEYKSAKYPTLKDFEEKMKNLIKEDSVIKVDDKVKYYNRYYALISVDGEEAIHLTVNYDDNENITDVNFENIHDIYTADYRCYTDNTELKLTYAINYIDHVGYVFEMKNISNRQITFSVEESYAYTRALANEKRFDLTNQINEQKIQSGGIAKMEMEFSVVYGEVIKPDRLYVKFKVNGTSYEYTFDVSFENEEFSM